MSTCARCTNPPIGYLNGTPLCRAHLLEVQREQMEREDRIYAEEEARLGIELPPEVLRDREFGPACWLLSAPFIARRAWRFVHVGRREVAWDELLEASSAWSSYERLVVELALNFWSGDGRFDPSGWIGFDRHNWQRVMEALALARGKRVIVVDLPVGESR
jgi:hypothetical protein